MFTRRLIFSFLILSILVFPAAFLRHLISVVVNIRIIFYNSFHMKGIICHVLATANSSYMYLNVDIVGTVSSLLHVVLYADFICVNIFLAKTF